ncbi:uncharacterized protein LOC133184496 [Saccostrea echinata]|uniref:uncharacterized protein LOC133184496 n=1 Tax=Saccostrea echinata TaxID=191078 RepID=UPI002A8313CC|nr:uncharacterized protein LOC133184496 [Saccostrea echinata]
MSWVFHVKNETSLNLKYIDNCGSSFLCSGMNKPNASTHESSSRDSMNCPVCLCTHDCEVKGRCCPDISLSTCIKPMYFVNEYSYMESNKFMMVSACPQQNGNLEDDCLMVLDRSNFHHLAPVVSRKTNITYVNAKCSKCHGERDVIAWSSSVTCFDKDFDINIYSDVDGLWAGMKKYDCFLEYFPQQGSYPTPCEKQFLIADCNVTGEWDVYDEDVESACKNYWNQYGVFQNVFCFFCNTGIDQRQFLRTQYTILIGNITKQGLFDKDITILEEWNKYDEHYKAKLTLLSLDVSENVKQILKDKNYTSNSEILSENLVNLTSVYTEYVRSGGYQDWCQEEHQVQNIYPGFRSRRNCSCDQDCYKSASCCPDAAYYHKMACFLPFVGKNDDPEPKHAYFVISKCPKQYTDIFVKHNCEKSSDYELLNVPVINVKTKEAYRNHYCYLCNNQDDIFKNTSTEIKTWNITIVCPRTLYPMFIPSIDILMKSAEENKCFIHFTTTFQLETCDLNNFSIIQKCNITGMVKSVSQDVLTMCEDPLMSIMAKSRNYIYKNQICDICNTEVFEEPLGVCTNPEFDYLRIPCEYGELNIDYYPHKNIFCKSCNPIDGGGNGLYPTYDLPSYRNLFSIIDTEERIEQTSTKCKESEFLDVFTMRITSSFSDSLNRTALEEHVMNFPQLTINFEEVFLTFQESVQAWYIPILYKRKTSRNCLKKSSTPTYENKYAFDVNDLLTCTQIQIERDEFYFSRNEIHIFIPAIKKQFEINEYIKSNNGSIRICSDSYKLDRQTSESVMQSILNVLTYICTVVSLTSLILTIFTYCSLPILRTLPGKIIMCFIFSLFFAQLLFLVQSHVKDNFWCSWVGGLTHYFWVSVFTCTNISSFHMFKLFVTNSLLHGNESAERKLFCKYCCVAFFSPILLVAINLIFGFSAVQSFRFGYGGSKCFLASPLALLVLFILPVILQIIFNVIMFSITFHCIRKTPKLKSSKDRHEFSIFFKLFLLTGITWLLVILDGFFEISLFSFLATIVNGSQGVFLFISYVCNWKVLGMLKNKFLDKASDIAGTSTNKSFLSNTGGSSSRFAGKKEKFERENTIITKI